MKDIKNFTKKIIDRHFESYSKADKDFIYLISILNILKKDRFLKEYQNLYIYPNNNELKLFFNCDSKNNEVIIEKTDIDTNKLPIFLSDEIYNALNKFKNIIYTSKNEEDYNININNFFSGNPEMIGIIRENRNVFNQNYMAEDEYIFKKILLNIDKENPFSFGFKPKIKNINLDKVKNNLFTKKIFPLSILQEQYKNEINIITKELEINFPELFMDKKEIIENSKIEQVMLRQGCDENSLSFNLKAELIKTPYNIESSIPLYIKGLNFLNSAFALHTGKTNSNFIFLKSNDGELLGGISYSNKEGSIINEIGFSFTNKAYRGFGVATKLYDILAQESIKKGRVLFNTFYTEDGEAAIPGIKQKLKNKYKNIFIVDLDHKNDNEELNRAMSNFNYEFKDLILNFEKNGRIENTINEIKTSYYSILPFVKKNILTSNDERKFIKNNIDKIKNDIECKTVTLCQKKINKNKTP